MRAAIALTAVLALSSPSCGGNAAVPPEDACSEAALRLGHRVCLHQVSDLQTWTGLTFPAAAVDQARATTYMVPAANDARLPTVFVDASAFDAPEQSLHFKFLTGSFPEFSLLQYEEYLELITDPQRREWFAGNVTEFVTAAATPMLGFTVWDLGVDPAAVITCAQFEQVRKILAERLPFAQVVVVPANDLQRQSLEGCGLSVHDPSTALDYEVYTAARGCGTLRRYTLAELADAEAAAGFGWQDILVIDEAPLDVETVISGIVTGTRQGELSHLNVRSASRGTPNCYVKDAHALFAAWEGERVALECAADEVTVVPITPTEAQACWEELKPEPVAVVPADLTWTEFVALPDLPTGTLEERRTGIGRFGSKGTNLGTLYQRIDPVLQLQGFLIPVGYYASFMVDNGFQATLDDWLEDPDFSSDGALRRARLEELRAAMEAATCDPELVTLIGDMILETWGADDVMVRFRSSSNAEDSLTFNGAGLYDSTSVCLADDLDADAEGPSHCDLDKGSERTICRGLKRVWASLWNMKAVEERAWYGIDHREAAMGVLVNTRTKGELANIVAFSGNPLLPGDGRYLVNAQLGELDVVAAQSGVWPELDLLTIADGAVTEIERVKGSTELPAGEWVLDDLRLEALGADLAEIVEVYPIDEEAPAAGRVLLDTEWKLRADGQLIIKQVRPFLD